MKINLNQRNYNYKDLVQPGYNSDISGGQLYDFVRDELKPMTCDVNDMVNDISHKNTLAIDPKLISNQQIKNMLFTSKIYSSTGLTVQELNVLSYITLLTSALKEATLKIDQLQLNVLTLDQEVRLLKERNDSTNAE